MSTLQYKVPTTLSHTAVLTEEDMQQNRSRVSECNEAGNKFNLKDKKGKTGKIYYRN